MKKIKIVSITVLFISALAITIINPNISNFKNINIIITFIGLFTAYIQILYKNIYFI